MNGLLTTKVLHYIDLTVRKGDDSTSPKRLRPPLISKNKSEPGKARAGLMAPAQLPENNQFYDTGDTPIGAQLSNAGLTPLPGINKMNIASDTDASSFTEIGTGADLSSTGLGGEIGALTREDYFEKVRLKVERNNSVPMGTISTGGVVTVQFVINLDGTIRDLEILKPSTNEVFNRQALKAVRDSVPFPKPPPYLFKEPFLFPQLNIYYHVY